MSNTPAPQSVGSDPVTAIANVVGLALQLINSESATRYSRKLAEIRKDRAAEFAKYPAWDASKIRTLFDEEEAILVAVEAELLAARARAK